MARYCFYCGRELQTGEKCSCRHHQQAKSADNQKQTGETQQSQASAAQGPAAQSGAQPSASAASSRAGSHQSADKASSNRSYSADQGTGRHQRQNQTLKSFWQQLKTRFTTGKRSPDNKHKAYGQHFRPSSGQSQHGTHATNSTYGKTSHARHNTKSGRRPFSSQTGNRRHSGFNLSEKARKTALYFIQPADQMREIAAQRRSQPVMQLIFFHAFTFGMFFLIATDQQHLHMILGLNVASAQQGNSLMVRLFLLVQGIGMGAVGYLLHVLVYQLLLRYIFRQAYAFRQLMTGLSGSCFFSGVFILGGVFLLSGSFFSALLMLLTGFGATLLMQRIALNEISGLNENKLLLLTILAAMIFTSILALFLNLSLPVLDILLEQSIII